MPDSKNKTIKLVILAIIICLISGYFYYDYQRYQGLQEEMANLKMEIIASRKAGPGLGENQLLEETELIQVGGTIKKMEDGVIVLGGKIFSFEEKMLIRPDDPDNKEYRIAINRKTSINRQNQKIGLEELGEKNIISVIGKVNPYNNQEVAAEAIFVLR